MRFVKTAENLFGLPNGFKRVDYIQSTGTQYIDTGIKAKTGLTVEARLKYTTNTGIFCGAITTVEGSGDRFYPINFAQSGKVSFTYLDSAFSASTSLTSGNVYTIKTVLGATKQEMFVDGVSSGSTSKTNVVEINCTLGLFALHRGESYDVKWVSQVPATLYYFKIWDGDTLVRDFIPCIDPLGIPCLYDLVGKKTYYNQGTGEFTVGRQIIPVEYLESSGTQYIDTGLKGKSGISAKTKVNYTYLSGSASHAIGGEYTTNTSCYFGMVRANGHFTYLYKNSVVETTTTISTDTDYDIDITLNNGNQRFVINGNVVSTGTVSGDFTSTNNLFLYAINSVNGADVYGSLKMYYMQISDNGTLIRDYIPCKDENNVGFMFDTLSGTVYLNAGTGAFVVGQNKYKMKLRLIRDNILPTGYTQVEYIGATNANTDIQYAVGNYRLTDTTDWEITFSAENSNNSWVMGQPTWVGVHYRKDATTSNLPRVGIVNSSAASHQCYVDYTNNEKITLALKGTDVYANGVKAGSIIRTSAPATQTKYGIFAYKDVNQALPNLRIQSARIYRLKLWDNGVLVQDLIPAINNVGVAGFYERVNKTFIEKESNSTSDFTTGKPVLPLVRFIKDILPAWYKAVNYLGSDSTAYIDTGVSGANNNLKIEMGFSYSKFYAYGYFFSNYESEQHDTTRFLLDASNNSRGLAYINTKSQNGAIYTPYNLTINDKHNVVITKTTVSLDGVITTNPSPPAGTVNTKNIILFNRGAGSYTDKRDIGMRCWSFKIWDNNILVRNFIPVIRLLDNKAGMWDTVTKQFYTTPVGNFITG